MASTVTHLSGDIAASEKGANNGVATLGSDGKVPSAQLPSYVDDVLEYASKSSFPATGESGKIYVDTTTNKTYRWSRSDYVEISQSLALGETSSTAYAGDKGKANADAISSHTGNTEIHVTSANKSNWDAKYDKPSSGIPKTDLASGVQTSLANADTAIQTKQDKLSAKQLETLDNMPEGELDITLTSTSISDGTTTLDISGKQDTLVSGTNIKTINGNSILGTGNLNIIGSTIGYEEIIFPIGGKVFLDTGSNGATYTFYDTNKNEIAYTDIDDLDDAVYYTVEGTPTSDRFYVVAADSNQADYNSTYGVNVGTNKYWGYYQVPTGATTDTISSGKTNTATILAITDTSEYNAAHGKTKQSIWEWLNDVNSNEYGGCHDWFIGSKAEYDALHSSDKAGSLIDSKSVWSSVEVSDDNAYHWKHQNIDWVSNPKNGFVVVVAFRAF